DLSSIVAGLRALLVQALHPLAMAGVDQHSDWRRDPVGRLAATSSYLATVSYGDRAAAERAAARVRRMHEHVNGTDPVTGRPYAATDPALLLWVHATLVESTMVACELFGTPMAATDGDRYVAEMAVAAELVGIPAALVPLDLAGLRRYLSSVRPELRCTPAAADAAAFLLDPPGPDPGPPGRDPAGARRPRRGVPGRARRAGGAAADRPPDARRAARMRKALAAAAAGAALAAAGLIVARRRGFLPPRRGRLRVRRGLAALQLAARGGARYTRSTPRLV